ncbi:MAG: MCE family protein [Deltaproteobacteria bacterium]|nr:MCE family protein [Deltaproteobacteria bacterium]
MRRNRRIEMRVGIFVVVALLVGGSVSFLIGNQRNVFRRKTSFHASFEDVGGLRAGSPVRVAGVTVGTVGAVDFGEDGRIEVSFEVVNSAAALLRGTPEDCTPVQRAARKTAREAREARRRAAVVAGEALPDEPELPRCSVVTIGSKGMLGDRLIAISVGQGLPTWDAEDELPVEVGGGLEAMLGEATDTMDSVGRVARNLRLATDPFADQAFSRDMSETAHNLAKLTGMLANGDGAVQRLMTDPRMAEDVTATLRSMRTASGELAGAARGIRSITNEIAHGDGSAHAILYGHEGAEAVTHMGDAAGELSTLLHDVREGEGTAHELVYGEAGGEMLGNLNSATADLAAITADVRAGRGTLGGLLTDPSIYEDVKRLVGDLERNDILRALVRYSIRRDRTREQPPEIEEAP